MDDSLTLLDEIRLKYFTEECEVKDNCTITFHQISNYEYQLLQIVLQDGSTAVTDAIESFIDELKKGAK